MTNTQIAQTSLITITVGVREGIHEQSITKLNKLHIPKQLIKKPIKFYTSKCQKTLSILNTQLNENEAIGKHS